MSINNPDQPNGEIILYNDINYGGIHTHLFTDTPDLSALTLLGAGVGIIVNPPVTWSQVVSCLVIVGGYWTLYKDAEYKNPLGPPLGPGLYSTLPEGYGNDDVCSMSVSATYSPLSIVPQPT